jgi:hypothetical protein
MFLPNMGCMVYFHWTTKRHGQKLGLVEVMLVREMLEWDIHDIPWCPNSSSFESVVDNIL